MTVYSFSVYTCDMVYPILHHTDSDSEFKGRLVHALMPVLRRQNPEFQASQENLSQKKSHDMQSAWIRADTGYDVHRRSLLSPFWNRRVMDQTSFILKTAVLRKRQKGTAKWTHKSL